MPPVSPSIQRLATELLALETIGAHQPESPEAPAQRIFETLRTILITLVGLPGYKVLLSRALAVAGEEDPSLKTVRVADDGALEGLGAVASALSPSAARPAGGTSRNDSPSPAPHPRGALLVTHLLGLLAVFIGEPLTFRLVQNAWPHAPSNALSPATESQP
jgi:hypothetical protein